MIGGAIGAIMVQFPFGVLIASFEAVQMAAGWASLDLLAQAEMLEGMSTTARQQGLLALEIKSLRSKMPSRAMGCR